MTSHALTSSRYVFENRIGPHTSMATLEGFSLHLLLSVLYTQVEELHKSSPSPLFSPSSSWQQEKIKGAKGKLKKQLWVLSAQRTISVSGFAAAARGLSTVLLSLLSPCALCFPWLHMEKDFVCWVKSVKGRIFPSLHPKDCTSFPLMLTHSWKRETKKNNTRVSLGSPLLPFFIALLLPPTRFMDYLLLTGLGWVIWGPIYSDALVCMCHEWCMIRGWRHTHRWHAIGACSQLHWLVWILKIVQEHNRLFLHAKISK